MIIDTASDCTISQLMKCWFESKYNVLVISGDYTQEEMMQAFYRIHTEYVDLAGLYKNKEFELLGYINHLETRINIIAMSINLQRNFLDEFDIPLVEGFKTFKTYNHNLYWDFNNPDKLGFLSMLKKIETRTLTYKGQLIEKKKELFDLQKNKVEKKHTTIQSRQEFIRTLNALGKFGFRIDKNETTVEELALMVLDWQKELNQNKTKK